MRQIRFPSGETMPWQTYRNLMNGTISPQAAVASMRREPQGALDSALRRTRRHAWDQEPNGGRLTPEYCRATDQFLTNAGLDPDDVAKVGAILAKYMNEETEDMASLPMTLGTMTRNGDPEPGGSQDSRHAYDAAGRRLPPKRIFSDSERTAFERRFPEASHIKVI